MELEIHRKLKIDGQSILNSSRWDHFTFATIEVNQNNWLLAKLDGRLHNWVQVFIIFCVLLELPAIYE